jgi:hypothetical protein
LEAHTGVDFLHIGSSQEIREVRRGREGGGRLERGGGFTRWCQNWTSSAVERRVSDEKSPRPRCVSSGEGKRGEGRTPRDFYRREGGVEEGLGFELRAMDGQGGVVPKRDSRLEVEEGPNEWAQLVSDAKRGRLYRFGSGAMLGQGRNGVWAKSFPLALLFFSFSFS